MDLLNKNVRVGKFGLLLLISLVCPKSKANEGIPMALNKESAQIIMSLCSSQTGLILSTGRAHQNEGATKQYFGSVRQMTTSSSVGVTGDTSLQIAGATDSNLNSTQGAAEAGSAYYDTFDTDGENLVASCAYDSGRSVWWAVTRAVKSTGSGNRTVVAILKIPVSGGAPTYYDTGIGGDSTNSSNNKHGLLGGPKSLNFDSSTDMLFVTGFRGDGASGQVYEPYIAQIRISSNSPTHTKITPLTNLNGGSASGWRGVGLTRLTNGGHIFGVASTINPNSSGFNAFDYTPATYSGGWSGGSYTYSAVSLTGYTAYVKPTSIVNNGSDTLYVSGAAKAESNGLDFGFVAALSTGLSLDTAGFNTVGFRASQIASKSTAFNDLVYVKHSSCDSNTARIFVTGYSYTGTNNKSLTGKFTTAGALASWGTNNSGFHQPIEFSEDEINTAITYDNSSGTLVVAGRRNFRNENYVKRTASLHRTYPSCISITPPPYLDTCSGTLNGNANGVNFTVNKNATFSGSFTFTYSDLSTSSKNGRTAGCTSSNTGVVSAPNGSGTFTAANITGPATSTISCGVGGGYNSVNCGSWVVTVQSLSYGPGGNNTQMLAMLP